MKQDSVGVLRLAPFIPSLYYRIVLVEVRRLLESLTRTMSLDGTL